MATWWEITFTGEPTETDLEHVAGLIREGFTSGQLIEDDVPVLPDGMSEEMAREARAELAAVVREIPEHEVALKALRDRERRARQIVEVYGY